jgi:hypothetical protein
VFYLSLKEQEPKNEPKEEMQVANESSVQEIKTDTITMEKVE